MRRAIILLFVFVISSGCGEFVEDTMPLAPMTIQLPIMSETALPENLEKVVLEISGEGFPTITQSVSKPFTEDVEFSLDVPIGKNREFKVTVSRTGSLRTGYLGKTVADVTEDGGTVPIDLQFINFMSDLAGEGSGPDISFVSFSIDTNGTSETSDDIITLDIDFANSIESSHLVLFIEFDKDNDSATGDSETIIHRFSGTAKTNFKSGSDFYILVEQISGGYGASLYNSSDSKVEVPASAKLSASSSGSKEVTVTISAAGFAALIDSNGQGSFNILAGTKSSLDLLEAPNFSSFTASDVAVGEEAIGAAEYDAYFSTSSL